MLLLAAGLLATGLPRWRYEHRSYTLTGSLSAPDCVSHAIANATVRVGDVDNFQVRDVDDANLIGSTTTSPGTFKDLFPGSPTQYCVVTFTLTVPRTDIYQLKIGAHDALDYSFEEMQNMRWEVAVALCTTGGRLHKGGVRRRCLGGRTGAVGGEHPATLTAFGTAPSDGVNPRHSSTAFTSSWGRTPSPSASFSS